MAPLSPISHAQTSFPQPGTSFDAGWHNRITRITNPECPTIQSLAVTSQPNGIRARRNETKQDKSGEEIAKKIGKLPALAREWLESHTIPEGVAKDRAVAALYRDTFRPKSITQAILAWHHGISRRSLIHALARSAPSKVTSWLQSLLPAESHPDAKTVTQLFVDNQQAMQALRITQRRLASHYGLTRAAMGKVIPAIPTEQQQATLNTYFPPDKNLTLIDVTQRYLENQSILVKQQISQRLLAAHCGIKPGVLTNAIFRTRTVALTSPQKKLVNSLLPVETKPGISAVAQLFVVNELILRKEKISRRILSTYYKVNHENMVRRINWLTAAPLTKVQKATLNTLLPTWDSAKDVARLIRDNEALLESWGVDQIQLAKHFQLHYNTLGRLVSMAKPLNLKAEDKAWLNSLVLAKKVNATTVARLYLDFKDAFDVRSITQLSLAKHFRINLSTLTYKIGCLKNQPLTQLQEIYLNHHLPLVDGMVSSQVAKFYVECGRRVNWPGITVFQLATHYRFHLNSLRADIGKFHSMALKVMQITFLNARLSPQDAPDMLRVARFYLDHKDHPEWPKISPLQLAQHYQLHPDSLDAQIKSFLLSEQTVRPTVIIKTGSGADTGIANAVDS